jgi:hypothetical protein
VERALAPGIAAIFGVTAPARHRLATSDRVAAAAGRTGSEWWVGIDRVGRRGNYRRQYTLWTPLHRGACLAPSFLDIDDATFARPLVITSVALVMKVANPVIPRTGHMVKSNSLTMLLK